MAATTAHRSKKRVRARACLVREMALAAAVAAAAALRGLLTEAGASAPPCDLDASVLMGISSDASY